jgi:hypothetical protein
MIPNKGTQRRTLQALSPLAKGDHRGIECYPGNNLRLDFKKESPLFPLLKKKGDTC